MAMLNEFSSQRDVKLIENNEQCLANKNKDDFNERLLKLVFDRPPLFNYSLPIEERSMSVCNKLWKEVADELSPIYGPLDLDRLKSAYKYHRNRYTRYRSAVSKLKCTASSPQASKIYPPKHMEILCQLESFIRDYKTNSVNSNITKDILDISEATADVLTTRMNIASPNICRACLIERTEMDSIFSLQPVNNKFIKVSKMISMCTGLEFSEYDQFSNFICDSCINAVSLAFEFRSKCWESHTFFMQKTSQERELNEIKSDSPLTDNNQEIVEFIEPEIVVNRPKPPRINHRKIDEIYKLEITDRLKQYADITLDDTVYRGKRYKCRHCEQKYLAAHLMIEHLENIHKFRIKPDNWIKCPKCPKNFPNQYRLTVHERQHKDVKVICQQCGVSVSKGRFAEHFRRHTGEKPFKCNLCDFRTAQISSIRSHRLTHTGEKPALCHICGRAYRTASRRAVHMRTHSDDTPFKCMICKKGFKRKEFLKLHMQTHEPSKMYECEICNRKFSQKGPHRVHMMQHTGRRPHKCSECGKGFIQRHCWRTHMKNHHNITVL